ncbi:hypothetical protein TorRG33x02_005460, partial [Trema orientale]
WHLIEINSNRSSEPQVQHHTDLIVILCGAEMYTMAKRVIDLFLRHSCVWAATLKQIWGMYLWTSAIPPLRAIDDAILLYHPVSKGWPPPKFHLEDKVFLGARGIDRIQQDVSRGMTS